MAPQAWRGIGIAALVIGILIGSIFAGFGAPIFALLIFGAFALLVAPALFATRRAAGGTPEPGEEEIGQVGDPNAPPDATPRAPHGYTTAP